ncbi:unnamed protein product [Leuciscus chuanchicus]
MSGFNFDAEDLELEDTLQDVNRFLQVLESEAQKELKAQREQTPTPVRWKKRDRHGFVIPKRPSSSKKSSGMPSGSEVLRQELLELLEDVVDDEVLEDTAVICEASSESAATDWEIRNKVSSQKWKEARPFLLKNMLATRSTSTLWVPVWQTSCSEVSGLPAFPVPL